MTTGGINTGELLGDVIVGAVAIKLIDSATQTRNNVNERSNQQHRSRIQHRMQTGKTQLEHHTTTKKIKLQKKMEDDGNRFMYSPF
jgi:hypothetical protein